MTLRIREMPFEIPKYSLTGDILAFKKCGLQYRYYNGSSLPPSRPVQMWTGEFIHGVMEESYRLWEQYESETRPDFPWPFTPIPWDSQNQIDTSGFQQNDIGYIGKRIEDKLRASGKVSRSRQARESAYRRAEAAINILGPFLFPLITKAEEKISGTRKMPQSKDQKRRGDRYELTGVADVISNVEFHSSLSNNKLVMLLSSVVDLNGGAFDVIVDYKAARRPSIVSDQWKYHEWQIQTYAWLRSQKTNHDPVKAGIVVYINELAPSGTDLGELLKEIESNETDVCPRRGSKDYNELYTWNSKTKLSPKFTEDFLLSRAVRIIDVTDQKLSEAVKQIDITVNTIEDSARKEFDSGNICDTWDKTGEEQDCVACDFKHFCPSTATSRGRTLSQRSKKKQ